MGISISNPSYDKVYTAYAWRYNSIFLNMTQGEGIEDTGVVWNDDGTINQQATSQLSVTADHVKVPRFQLRDDRGIIDLTDCQVVLAVKRPKGAEDLLACYTVGDASDGTIACPITRSVTAIEGRGLGEIRVLSHNAVIKFYGIHFNIYKGVSDLAAEQSTQFAALVSALQKIALVNPDGSNTVDMDTEVTENGTNPVASGVLYDFVYSVFNDGSKVSYVTNATVDNATETGKVYYTTTDKALIIPVSAEFSQAQFRLARDGKIYARCRSRSSTSVDFPAWGTFEQVEWKQSEIENMIATYLASVKSQTITAQSTHDQIPTTKAVVDYIAANYEALSNKLTSEAGIDGDSTDTEYPTAKAVFDLGVQIVDGVNKDITETNSNLSDLAEEVGDLKSAITQQIHTEITNLSDGYINLANGEIMAPTGDIQKHTADFIPVIFGERIIGILTLSASRYRSMGVFGYDADKNFLGRLAAIDGSVSDKIALDHTIANEAVAFVRYSFSTYGVLTGFSVDSYVSNTQIINVIGETAEKKVSLLFALENIGYQYLDTSKFTLGYYNWDSGQTDIQKNSAAQNWRCMVLPELEAGTYHYNKFFNTNFSFIRNLTTNVVRKMTDEGFSDTANGTITISYPFTLYITCHDQLQDMQNGMLASSELPFSYVYGYYKAPVFDVNAQGQKTWIVGADYIPTIQEACNRASANDIIFIKCGTYTEQVSIWNKKLHLIGEDKANTKLVDHSGAYNTPPLEMSLGSLSNMTIIEDGSDPTLQPGESGYNAAYCLHIEWTPPANEVFYINNCDFINYVHSPLGCGLYQDYTVHFKDCTFRCEATNEGNMERGSFYFHSNVNPNVTGQKIIAENCIISSAGQRWAVLLGVPAGANNSGSAEARFSGCTIWNDNDGTADSIAYFDTSGGADVLKVVHSCGNTVDALNNW